jgi:hypothetical protein
VVGGAAGGTGFEAAFVAFACVPVVDAAVPAVGPGVTGAGAGVTACGGGVTLLGGFDAADVVLAGVCPADGSTGATTTGCTSGGGTAAVAAGGFERNMKNPPTARITITPAAMPIHVPFDPPRAAGFGAADACGPVATGAAPVGIG